MVRGLTIAGVCLAAVAAGPETLVRTKAPARWGIAGGNGARVLVAAGGEMAEEGCAALRATVERWQAFGLRGRAGTAGCRTVWDAWGAGEAPAGGVEAFVVDEKGVIRYQKHWPLTAAGVRAMGDGVMIWERGRSAFAGSCGLCHGEDGVGEASQEAKSLAGVSTRMGDGEIVEHAERVGAVALSTWPRAEVDALLTFIRGL